MNDSDLSALREQLPACQSSAYLNAGTFGPLPRATHAAVADELEQEFWRGRIGLAAYARYGERASAARRAFAEVFSSGPERVALTHSTTGAVNLALGGLDWHAGDEIVSTDAEHPGLDEPLDELARRYGVVIHRAAVLGVADTAAPVEELLTDRTRLIAVSHVLWGSGQVLPLARLSAAARDRGALLLADGAQSVGAIAIDPAADGVDLYTASGQKWLLGPSGTGALWIREGVDEQLMLGQPGYLSRDLRNPEKPLWTGARRFDGASLAPASLRGVAESVRFRREAIGWNEGFERAQEMAERFRAVLADLPRVEVDRPAGPLSSLVTFAIDGIDAEAASSALEQRGVLVRWIERPRRVRASVGFWTDDGDLARLCEAIGALK
ncbi:MAG: aminotransferase class V-fold PLP-dependent enzyme [Gaiellales bacterium]